MEKITITFYDSDGNEFNEDYHVPSQVREYVESLEKDYAVMFGNLIGSQMDNEELRNVVDAYRILCGGTEELN